jgi:hypothetical protein
LDRAAVSITRKLLELPAFTNDRVTLAQALMDEGDPAACIIGPHHLLFSASSQIPGVRAAWFELQLWIDFLRSGYRILIAPDAAIASHASSGIRAISLSSVIG